MSKHPIFFIHVMKTAGTAVSTLLRSHFDEEECYPLPIKGKHRAQKLFVLQLLKLSTEQKAPLQFYSVHMAAWVAGAVAPDHAKVSLLRDPVARTVSHLRHIARGLNVDSLDAIYHDPGWHSRLSNYQTRLFSMSQAAHTQRIKIWQAAFANAAAEQPGAPLPTETVEKADNESAEVTPLQREMFTGMVDTQPQTEADLAAAIAMVDSFDLVGVTEHLDAFILQLEQQLGIPVAPVKHLNAASDQLQASEALVSRIREDNALDSRLYNHVVERMASWL